MSSKHIKKSQSQKIETLEARSAPSDASFIAEQPLNHLSNKSQGEVNTTAQTIDDSFTEVTQKRSRRENKQMAKEKM